ncbi:transglycosylase domain-containing protein [Streptomyces sp. NBC_00878]|uniref:transglycosylase domain-containing protein n=1 Tax=Streptomyces sp. NBC_00878 TaxID=2975854 RepID=UPI00224DEC4A|nr:transglycosylase domain-containing protein [Streptomyces sp. NBC_00878]MCX4908366.1 penicillin-binding protein [Streptomyces sp. NBC_00878]
MNDQPQPQQPSEGWVPREPGAVSAARPDTPGKKPKRPRRTGWRRLIPTWRLVLGTLITVTLLLIGAFALGYYLVKIPAANSAAVKQSNVYLYADGSQLARDGEVNRENVTLTLISKDAQHAVLAAEDRDFYTESAVDPKAMVRAGWNTATGKGKQSGSTITQQYVKNYYLAQEQTVTRKAKEFFIAIKLDREKSKDDILEGYLNTSYFGRNAYGIQAAAQAYYGVDAKDLTVGQGAYLAALLNAPSEFDVVAHPENKPAALARWNYVLDGMVKKKWISAEERSGVKLPEPRQTVIAAGMSGQRGYIVKAVNDYLIDNKIVDEDQLNAGGYRITTTLQKPKQAAFVKAVDDQVMEQLDKKGRKVDNYVRAGGASIDPKTGKVLAMYGGIDYTKQYYNNATRRDYQVGSTFKPFVFTAAVQNDSTTQDGRTITPNTVYDGTNERPVQGWNGDTYAPENEDQASYGPISVRTATDNSVNSVYAQMAVDVAPEKVEKTAVGLGIPSDTPDLNASPSIALGTATASVLDMAEAYATLANHGKRGTYTMIGKITKDGADVVDLPGRKTWQAVSREAADTTTSILQSVVEGGTGTAAQAAGRPAAGKTGTAEEDQAAWFAGYTPNLATVVAIMGQDPDTGAHKSLYGALGQPRINGGGYPAQIWAQFTKDALNGAEVEDFDLNLQDGAEEQQLPPSDPGTDQPGTDAGEDNGGATTGGEETPATEGQTDGGTTTGDTTGDGGTTTDGGTTGDGGTTTDGGTTGDTTEGTTGGTTGDDTGATTDGATTDGGGEEDATTGTTLGSFP